MVRRRRAGSGGGGWSQEIPERGSLAGGRDRPRISWLRALPNSPGRGCLTIRHQTGGVNRQEGGAPRDRRGGFDRQETDRTAKLGSAWPPFAWSGLPGRDPSAVHPPRFQRLERPKAPAPAIPPQAEVRKPSTRCCWFDCGEPFAFLPSWLHLAPLIDKPLPSPARQSRTAS